ncbi:hypothetical protein ACJIZ3_021351 [Penstemon smallii]|uniref:CCHC-type domain-containing protein n=1 Tax=Penstemon smallii TaxID=265156 RepID=A0ABD3SM08_9LAMI
MEELLKGLGSQLILTEEEQVESRIPEEAWSGSNLDTELILVGRVLVKKDINVEALERTMSLVWSPVKGIEVKKIGDGRFLFMFRHKYDRQKALSEGPWSFDKNLIVLNTIGELDNPRSVNLDWNEFHVHVSGIPFTKMNRAMAVHIGDCLGRLIGKEKRDYVTKPIRRLLKLKSDQGDTIVVTFQYERLSNFCYFCGKMDHISSACEKQYDFPPEEREGKLS